MARRVAPSVAAARAPRLSPLARALLAGMLAAPAATVLCPVAARAGTIVVMNCGDDGTGSLREAVRDLAVSGDTIDLRFLPCSTITLTTGAIVTSLDDLDFAGPGMGALTISGGGQFPVLQHVGSGTLRVGALTIERGYKYSATAAAPGGCIYSQGHVALDRVHVHDCVARTTGPHAARGGGIHVSGDLVLSDSIVSGNDAIAGDADALGGGFFAGGALRSKYSLVSGNEAGGARGSFGAGVALGDAFMIGSSVSGNEADTVGGLALLGSHAATALVVRNSTIGLNRSRGLSPATGLFAGATLHLANSTIAFNVQDADPAALPGAAAGLYLAADSQLVSSIVANNFGAAGEAPLPSDLGAIDASVGGDHNLVVASLPPLPAGTLRVDPRLAFTVGAVPTNHGHTVVFPFADPASPAIDAGSNPFALGNDQRGAPYRRVEDAAPDIGAYEADTDRIFYDGFDWDRLQSAPPAWRACVPATGLRCMGEPVDDEALQ